MQYDIERLFHDYPFFVDQIWLDRRLNRYHTLGEAEHDILNFIATGPSRRGVLAPRGIGKTTFGNATFACWRLFRDPNTKVIIPSKSLAAAKKMVKLIRHWIDTVPFLQHLKPEPNVRGGRVWRNNTDMFDVGPSEDGKDPSVLAIGVDGQLPNCRAHLIMPDDVETPENTETFELRDALDEKVKEFASVLYPGGEIVYFGTYHHEESLYLKLARRGYHFQTWPLLYPSPSDRLLNLAPFIQERLDDGTNKPGDLVFPHRHDELYVAEKKAEGRRHFAMQQMLICDMGEHHYPLTMGDFIVPSFAIQRDKAPNTITWGVKNGQGMSTRIESIPADGFGADGFYHQIMFDNDWSPYGGTIMWIDPSGRGEDKTGYGVVSQLNGYLWIKDGGGLTGGFSPDVLHQLARKAREHGVQVIYVEDNFGQGMFPMLLEPVLAEYFIDRGADDSFPGGWACRVETVRVTGQKETRIIDALEALLNNHRLVLDRRVADNKDFRYQLTHITRQRNSLEHEDELESVAMAVRQWRDAMKNSPEKAAARSRETQLRKDLIEHYRECGLTVNEPRWFQHH